ncbi:MAG: dethiobiotin synthase [Acidobacteriota bacterium]|nr:dethiobiotin synthase [Acidobacteriota bacterium]
MDGIFVTATDTAVGKTILSAALLSAMARSECPVRAYKPALTGLDEEAGTWPADHELLAAAAQMSPDEVAPLRFGPAVAPHLAARLQGTPLPAHTIHEGARAALERANALGAKLIVEGVGGLLCPLADDLSVADVMAELALPALLAARPGLGTINHTLLTLDAARGRGIEVLAVVLTPWPESPTALEESNRDTIARQGEVSVHTLASVAGPDLGALADAGARLPWRRWLELR